VGETGASVITCPNCKASLPDWTKQCQFCQTETSSVLRPKQDNPDPEAFETPTWTLAAYYAVSALLLLSGLIGILTTLVGSRKDGLGLFDGISLVFDGVGALVGIGLLLRLEIVRGITNVICFLGILSGLRFIAFGLEGTLFSSWGLLVVVYGIIKVATYAFMIYLIGETDRYAWR
jgi:hypothetical protein